MYNSDPFWEGRAMENLHNINQNDSLFNQSILSRGSMQELLKSQEKELTKVFQRDFYVLAIFPMFVDQCMLGYTWNTIWLHTCNIIIPVLLLFGGEVWFISGTWNDEMLIEGTRYQIIIFTTFTMFMKNKMINKHGK